MRFDSVRVLSILAVNSSLLTAGTLLGVVVDSESGERISSAVVEVFLNTSLIAETQSEDTGDFRVDDLRKGQYRVQVAKDGYVDPTPSLSPDRFIFVPDGGVSKMKFSLVSASAITGRVLDSAGQPMHMAKVVALGWRSGEAGAKLTPVAAPAIIDDRGLYRIYGLAPGRYAVAVIPWAEEVGSPIFAPVYFPGVVEPARARLLNLAAGETERDVDLLITPRPAEASSLRGKVIGIPEDWGGRPIAVSVASLSEMAVPIATIHVGADGRFVFQNIPPGPYVVTAWGPIEAWGDDGPVAARGGRQGSRQIEVTSGPIIDLEIPLRSLNRVTARVSTEVASAESSTCYRNAHLALETVDPILQDRQFSAGLTNGSFAIPSVPVGRYRVSLTDLSGSCYLKEVRQQEGKTGAAILVDGDAHLDLVVSTERAVVSGRVIAVDGKPARHGLVLLVPFMSKDRGPADAPAATVNADGTFRLDQVVPGRYLALALDRVASSDYLDPLFCVQHGAIELVAAGGVAASVELKATR